MRIQQREWFDALQAQQAKPAEKENSNPSRVHLRKDSSKDTVSEKDPFDLELKLEPKRLLQIMLSQSQYCGSDDNCTGCGCNTCCSSC